MPAPLKESESPENERQKRQEEESSQDGHQEDPDGNVRTLVEVLDGDDPGGHGVSSDPEVRRVDSMRKFSYSRNKPLKRKDILSFGKY